MRHRPLIQVSQIIPPNDLGTLSLTVKDGNRGGKGEAFYSPPWDHGFDTCFSTESKVPTFWQAPGYSKNASTRYWVGPDQPATETFVGDDSEFLMNPALKFISEAQASDTPFLAVIWFHAPHKPYVLDPAHAEGYPQNTKEEKDKAAYWSCINAIDTQMGRLRAHLQELGIADQTVLAYTSDNGPEKKTPGTTGGLRARKRSLYEGGVRVPGLLVWPDRIKPGRTTDIPCVTSDYYPTVLDILGLWKPDMGRPIDGVSLLPLIDGTMQERPSPIGFASGKNMGSLTTALIDNRFKLVHAGQPELYDIIADPAETTDVGGKHPEVLASMKTTLATWLATCKASEQGADY